MRKTNDKLRGSTTWKTVVDLWANWEKQEASEEAALLPCRCSIPKSCNNIDFGGDYVDDDDGNEGLC